MSKLLLIIVLVVVAYLVFQWWQRRQRPGPGAGIAAPGTRRDEGQPDYSIERVDADSLLPMAGAVNLQEAIANSTPPREPGDDTPRAEDQRIYLTGQMPVTPSKGGGVLPIGKECPASHPVKGNVNSGLYHDTTMATWLHTSPEECFADAASAEAAGYRAPSQIERATPEQQAEIARRLAAVGEGQ